MRTSLRFDFGSTKGTRSRLEKYRTKLEMKLQYNSGPLPGYRANGCAVALMVALKSSHSTLPDDLSSYRFCRGVGVVNYGQALQAMKDVVKISWGNPEDFVLHSLRIEGVSTLAAGGEVSERVIERAGKSKSDAYKGYTVNDLR